MEMCIYIQEATNNYSLMISLDKIKVSLCFKLFLLPNIKFQNHSCIHYHMFYTVHYGVEKSTDIQKLAGHPGLQVQRRNGPMKCAD